MGHLTYYDWLEVPRQASQDQIEAAYRKLKKQYRGDAEKSRQLDEAYRTLSNPFERRFYDQKLAICPQPDEPVASQVENIVATSSRSGPEQRPVSSSRRQRTAIIEVTPSPELPPAHGSRQESAKITPPPEFSRSRGSRREPTKIVPSPGPPPSPSSRRKSTDIISPPEPPPSGGSRQKHTTTSSSTEPPCPPASRQPLDKNAVSSSRQDSSAVPHRQEPPLPPQSHRGGEKSQPEPPYSHAQSFPSPEGHRHTIAEDIAPGKWFVEVEFAGRVEQFPLRPGRNLIGRPSANSKPDIPLPDCERYISRHHAVIELGERGCSIIDLGSDNHTYLNAKLLPADKRFDLREEDEVVIEGRRLRLRWHKEGV